jgi:hypothetical protein
MRPTGVTASICVPLGPTAAGATSGGVFTVQMRPTVSAGDFLMLCMAGATPNESSSPDEV